MTVYIPTHLRAYTKQASVDVVGATLDELLRDLDRCFPGVRFRIVNEQDEIREHIRIFVNQEQVWDLTTPLRERDEVRIVAAISGG
jgi:molybdopterin converting factor small subunit